MLGSTKRLKDVKAEARGQRIADVEIDSQKSGGLRSGGLRLED